MALSAAVWIVMCGSIALLWLPSSWALYRTLRAEDRKLALLDEQGEIDTYSPRALTELHNWIQAHPDDEYASEARNRYNECVETLRETDESFYDWSDAEIEDLERLAD